MNGKHVHRYIWRMILHRSIWWVASVTLYWSKQPDRKYNDSSFPKHYIYNWEIMVFFVRMAVNELNRVHQTCLAQTSIDFCTCSSFLWSRQFFWPLSNESLPIFSHYTSNFDWYWHRFVSNRPMFCNLSWFSRVFVIFFPFWNDAS